MDQNQRLKLWEKYSKTHSLDIREEIILEYAPLVKLVAGRLSMYLGNNVEYDDLVGYGIFGLMDAIDKFDCKKNIKFETYASLRIRGSILDQIRKMDWIPRTIRQKQRKIDAITKEIEARYGRAATDSEIAKALSVSESEYIQIQSQMKITNVISLNEFLDQGSEIANTAASSKHYMIPEESIEQEELGKMLKEGLSSLTEKERRVIELYYYEELTLKEISFILDVTESRISQLHTKGLEKLKSKMGNYMGIFTN